MSDKGSTGAELDVKQLGAAVYASAPRLLIAAVIIAVATYGVLLTLAPRYASEAQISVVAKATNPLPERADRGADALGARLDKEAINTHVRALMAPDLLRRVAGEFKLSEKPEFNAARGSIDLPLALAHRLGMPLTSGNETDDDRVIASVTRLLEVSNVRDSRFIAIKFTSADPELAAAFANRLAEAYRDELVAMPVQETTDVMAAMQPKIAQLRHEVEEADAEVETYRARTDQFRGGAQSLSIKDQRLATLSDELIRAESARGDAEAHWRTARDMLASGAGDIVPEVQRSPLIQNLIQSRVALERQIFEAGATLLPAHPRMKQLKADLDGLKQQIDAEMRKVVQGLEKDWRALAGKVEMINAQIAAQKETLSGGVGDEARLRALEASASAKRTELERLQKQLEDNRSVVNMNRVPSEVTIVSRARASGVSVFPRKASYAGLAFAGTMIVGLAIVLTGQLLKVAPGGLPQPTGPDHGRRGPPGRGRERRPGDLGIAGILGGASQAMPAMTAALRQVLAVRPAQGGRRTLVVSSRPNVDASESALALARLSVRRRESVLLVGWDPCSVLAMPGIGGGTPGLSDVLAGGTLFDAVIRPLEKGIHGLPAGRPFRDEAALSDGDRLNMTFDVLDDAFDHVIVTGERAAVAALFQSMEGRFDAVLEVVEPGSDVRLQPNEVLGFSVQDMVVIRALRPLPAEELDPELRLTA